MATTAMAGIMMAGFVIAGCRGTEPVQCGPTVVEQLDPSNIHMLPNAAPPTYLTDPPTSGAHVAGLRVSGLQQQPIDPVAQVSSLEVGIVIIQHQNLDEASRSMLTGLAGDEVAVAPGRGLPARVVATGWGRKLRCNDVDLIRLRAFIAEAAPLAPGGHSPP